MTETSMVHVADVRLLPGRDADAAEAFDHRAGVDVRRLAFDLAREQQAHRSALRDRQRRIALAVHQYRPLQQRWQRDRDGELAVARGERSEPRRGLQPAL